MAQKLKFSRWIVRHGFLVRAVLLTTVSLSLLLLVVVPAYRASRELSRKIAVRTKEANEISDKVSILSGLDQTVLKERVEILDRALPPSKDVVLYLSAIGGLSSELGLSFNGISLAPGEVTTATSSAKSSKATRERGLLSLLETELKITGSKENIYGFLRAIEESLPLMQIKDANISVGAGESYTLGLRLAMLWAAPDPEAVKGTITLFDDKEEAYFQDLAEFRRFAAVSESEFASIGLGKNDLFAVPVSD
ncbi:MAG: hypothetical protein UY18_C0024G0011 [Microgenomates group bacterium GW2011_GWF2_47_9]|nr:MAG: hypothetical protein UY18_C0024G0011 [Microgenomates group bacterium GW2011_GWF2_47_9]